MPSFRRNAWARWARLRGGGRTVLFVSHNMAAVQNLCRRCIGLSQGRVFSDDSPSVVIEHYLDQSQQAGHGKLRTFERRRGDGRTRFTGVIFMDSSDRPITSAATGETIKIKLVTTGLVSVTARVSIRFSSLLGAPLFICSTDLTCRNQIVAGTKEIICEIPRLPLAAGTYRLTLFVEQTGSVSDWIEDGIDLVVENRDFFGSGRNTPRGWEGKTVLVDHFWSEGSMTEDIPKDAQS